MPACSRTSHSSGRPGSGDVVYGPLTIRSVGAGSERLPGAARALARVARTRACTRVYAQAQRKWSMRYAPMWAKAVRSCSLPTIQASHFFKWFWLSYFLPFAAICRTSGEM